MEFLAVSALAIPIVLCMAVLFKYNHKKHENPHPLEEEYNKAITELYSSVYWWTSRVPLPKSPGDLPHL